MKFILLIILTAFISVSLNAQSKADSINVENSFWGNNYYIEGIEFSRGDICDILETNNFSSELVNTSYNQKYWGYGTLSVGVLLVGASLYSVFESYENYGEQPTKSSFYIKSALAIGLNFAAIIYFSKSKKSFSKAIKAYNKCLNADSGSNEFKINIDFNRITFTYSM